jgi:predicted enzyme related to lactoylglutathione lyase
MTLMVGRMAPAVGVTDISRAVAFYCSVLGFTKTFENGSPVSFAIVERDGAELHLALDPGHVAPAYNIVHIMVNDATALHDRCVAHGAVIVKPLRDADFGLRCFVFADPDGNLFDVGQEL